MLNKQANLSNHNSDTQTVDNANKDDILQKALERSGLSISDKNSSSLKLHYFLINETLLLFLSHCIRPSTEQFRRRKQVSWANHVYHRRWPGKRRITIASLNIYSFVIMAIVLLNFFLWHRHYNVKFKVEDCIRWLFCPHCPKRFKKPLDLVRHLRIHNSIKPFKVVFR